GLFTDHERYLRPVAGAHFFHAGYAWDCGYDGAGAGDHRHLRSHLLFRSATPARDWHSPGTGRADRPSAVAFRALGPDLDRRRHRGWAMCRRSADAAAQVDTVWGKPARSADLHRGSGHISN